MAVAYEGIEGDAFSLASAFFGVKEMIQNGCSIADIQRFLSADAEIDLAEIAARVVNGNQESPPIVIPASLHLVKK